MMGGPRPARGRNADATTESAWPRDSRVSSADSAMLTTIIVVLPPRTMRQKRPDLPSPHVARMPLAVKPPQPDLRRNR